MKSLTLYLKRNLYFMISLFTVFLTVVSAIVLLFVFDLGKSVAQTSVGFVYLGSYESSQYEEVLTPRILQWQNTADYALTYQEYEWDIDLSHFVFDGKMTADQVRSDVNNPAFFSLSSEEETALYQELTEDLTVQLVDAFDFDALLTDIAQDMKLLKNRKTYELKNYLDQTVYDVVIDSVTIDNIDQVVVNEMINQLIDPIEIPENKRFYLIDELSSFDLSNEALSIIASALQYVTVKTPVEGYLFESYVDLPLWADDGMNVRILKLNQYDFSFFNPLQQMMTLHVESSLPNTITFTLKGLPFLTTYEREVVVGPTIHYQTTIVTNELLDALTPGVIITDTDTETIYELETLAGTDGYVTYYNRVVKPLVEDEFTITLYQEQTLPIHRVIEQHIVAKG
ncbi:MAG: hypothetical protein RBQ71_06990 [Acholeplasmataceae bacterium]|jgi:hypothetical protein|nr:hypothetical protein [Acholeplasmataceae bacterium]